MIRRSKSSKTKASNISHENVKMQYENTQHTQSDTMYMETLVKSLMQNANNNKKPTQVLT